MLQTFIITFFIMLVVVGLMAIGYIIKKKSIKGSCGGISNLGMDKVCNCEKPCDKKEAKLKEEAKQAQREKDRIL